MKSICGSSFMSGQSINFVKNSRRPNLSFLWFRILSSSHSSGAEQNKLTIGENVGVVTFLLQIHPHYGVLFDFDAMLYCGWALSQFHSSLHHSWL
jgi:hypothetical protein